jgi:hypothetical protein
MTKTMIALIPADTEKIERNMRPSFTLDLPGTYVGQLIVSDGVKSSLPGNLHDHDRKLQSHCPYRP